MGAALVCCGFESAGPNVSSKMHNIYRRPSEGVIAISYSAREIYIGTSCSLFGGAMYTASNALFHCVFLSNFSFLAFNPRCLFRDLV